MKKALRKLDRRFQLSRPGSVLILVVALLVLMALIGTAYLSTTRIDRYNTVQNTNNTEIDLLLEGVKNMAKATIVGSLNDPSLPFPYRPANSTIAKNWDAYDMYHQYTTDPLISTTPNDAWLSPRCPTDFVDPYPGDEIAPIIMWPCIGEPLTGNTFESPFAISTSSGTFASGVALTYTDRMSRFYVPPTPAQVGVFQADNMAGLGPDTPPGSVLTPTFATISYPDGTTKTYPAFTIAVLSSAGPTPPVAYSYKYFFESAAKTANSTQPQTYLYLAGDADGDGIADCGMVKLPVGQLNGLTYYAGIRIIDNCSAVNVNTAMSRRYDFNGAGVPTRYINSSTGTQVPTYAGIYNLGCFPANVGLAEMLQSYDGSATDNATGNLGTEFSAWMTQLLNAQYPSPGGVVTTSGQVPSASPIADGGTARSDFAYTTLGDLLWNQVARRPSNPGLVGLSTTPYVCQPANDTDEAQIAYHFVFDNPNNGRTPLELALHNSLYDNAPNGPGNPTVGNGYPGPPTRAAVDVFRALPHQLSSTSYLGTSSGTINANVILGWYSDNFDWSNDFMVPDPNNSSTLVTESLMSTGGEATTTAGTYNRPRRSIITADSAVSNLTPRPQLTAYTTTGGLTPILNPAPQTNGMSAISSTMCKASINTAPYSDLWRAFWLSMVADNGLSPLGTNSGTTTGSGYKVPTSPAMSDHSLLANQSIYTGSQFTEPQPASGTANNTPAAQEPQAFSTNAGYPQHPQAMFRSPLRIPADAAADNVFYGSGNYSYIEADQMVILRSAIAAANATAMRYPVQGSSAPIFAYDVPLKATVEGQTGKQIWARVYGVTQQPYITEVYANTNTNASQEPTTHGDTNTAPYVAIELFNPYNATIDLTNWQLAVVDRSPTSTPDTNRGMTTSSVIFTFPSGTIMQPYTGAVSTNTTSVYQGSYALLENLGGPGVTYRPASTNLSPTGSVAHAASATLGGPLIDITVPNLGKVIQQVGSYSQQELVLLRPLAAGGSAASTAEATTSLDQVPVDSFDFTGLNWGVTDTTTTPPTAIADTWHYVRGNASNAANVSANTTNCLWRFIYPGRYDASDPTPYAQIASTLTIPTPTQGSSHPVPNNPPYPNGQSTATPAYQTFSRRQQGVQAAHYRPGDTVNPANGIDPFSTMVLVPGVSLGQTAGGTASSNDNYQATYPVTFPFQYLNSQQPGAWPIAASANAFPFGQFARNSDLLQIPFVGSYVIFNQVTEPATSAGAPTQLASTDVSAIMEINPLPMDCSFAEDTDTSDDPPSGQSVSETSLTASGGPYIWNESVGHFAPINTQVADNGTSGRNLQSTSGVEPNLNQTIADSDQSLAYTNSSDPYAPYKVQCASTDAANQKYWRYHWASRLFDYLTVQNPNDDFFPNVQPGMYSTATPPLAVVNSSSIATAGDSTATPPSYTEDTVPVYGPININTAPWRVLAALRFDPFDDNEQYADQFTIQPATGAVSGPGGGEGIPDNTQLAQAIAYWRDIGPTNGTSNIAPQITGSGTGNYPYDVFKGPFTSLDDVLSVPAVQNYLTLLNFSRSNATDKVLTEPDPVQGHLSPFDFYPSPPAVADPAENGSGSLLTDGVRNDVEERFDLLDRISNQATVKSDVYTVYIVIQGWRNAGSTSSNNPPQMVTQRRAAFIIDRTGVTPTSSNVKIINVPTN